MKCVQILIKHGTLETKMGISKIINMRILDLM